jgi:hypothetical protein
MVPVLGNEAKKASSTQTDPEFPPSRGECVGPDGAVYVADWSDHHRRTASHIRDPACAIGHGRLGMTYEGRTIPAVRDGQPIDALIRATTSNGEDPLPANWPRVEPGR